MSYETILTEVDEKVGIITLNRPEAMNALNGEIQHGLIAACREAAQRKDVAAVIVYGGEKVFAAGADIKEMETMALSYPGVEKAYAIQAGRELRIIMAAEKSNDENADTLAFELSNRIMTEMRYPGQVKITVIREKRAVGIAK